MALCCQSRITAWYLCYLGGSEDQCSRYVRHRHLYTTVSAELTYHAAGIAGAEYQKFPSRLCLPKCVTPEILKAVYMQGGRRCIHAGRRARR